MAVEPGLTFKEFTSVSGVTPFYDNFVLFFAKDDDPAYRRTLAPYVALQRQAPNLEWRLRKNISALPKLSAELLEPHNLDLYTAYLIMRGHVASDNDLGIPR